MHDPVTCVLRIPNPFARHYDPEARRAGDPFSGRWSNRPSIAWITHHDPEADGTERSCYNAMNARDWDMRCENLSQELASWSMTSHDVPYFSCLAFRQSIHCEHGCPALPGPGDVLALTLSVYQVLAWRLHMRTLSPKMVLKAIRYGTCTTTAELFNVGFKTLESRCGVFRELIRQYLEDSRPWWKSWKLHFWHWGFRFYGFSELRYWWANRGKPKNHDVETT